MNARWKNQMEIQSMVWPGILFLILFSYIPMYGIVIAFKDYDIFAGVFNSPWVGLDHFKEFFTDPNFGRALRNTVSINLLQLIVNFPVPIIFALLLNELNLPRFKGFVQTLSYLPHFVSWVVFGGLVINILSPTNGVLNGFLVNTGIIDHPINFLANPDQFWLIYVLSDMVKGLGWGAILYIAAIGGVDQELYEAAKMDGANRFQRMRYITIPGIMGTIIIMFIFAVSSLLNSGFEQFLVLQNPLNLDTSEMLDTYVYKIGLQQMRYSYSTAVGLAKSVIAFLLLIGANYVARKMSDNSLI